MESFVLHNIKFKIPALIACFPSDSVRCVVNLTHTPSGQCSFTETGEEITLPPCTFFNGFPLLNFAPEAVPLPCPEPSLLHAEQHSAGPDHQHQGQQLGAHHVSGLTEKYEIQLYRKTMSTPTRPNVRNTEQHHLFSVCPVTVPVPARDPVKTAKTDIKKINWGTWLIRTLKDSRVQRHRRDHMTHWRMRARIGLTDISPDRKVPISVWRVCWMCYLQICSTRNCRLHVY